MQSWPTVCWARNDGKAASIDMATGGGIMSLQVPEWRNW